MPFTVLSGNPTGAIEEAQDSAFKIGNPQIWNMPAPASLTGAANTLTPAQIINGIVTVNNATTSTLTFPPASGATGIASALRPFSSRGIVAGDTIMMTIVAGGAGALTLSVAGATGLTFDANTSQSVPAGTSRELMIRFTLGTPGSETAVIF